MSGSWSSWWGASNNTQPREPAPTTATARAKDVVRLTQAAVVPTPERNTVDAVKGLCISHLQSQSRAFEDFLRRLDDLRSQVGLVTNENWQRRIAESQPYFKEHVLNNPMAEAIDKATIMITSLPESHQDLAQEIWEGGLNVVKEFGEQPLATALGTMIAALSNQTNLKWTVILQCRVYISQEHAKAVAKIDSIQPTKHKHRGSSENSSNRAGGYQFSNGPGPKYDNQKAPTGYSPMATDNSDNRGRY